MYKIINEMIKAYNSNDIELYNTLKDKVLDKAEHCSGIILDKVHKAIRDIESNNII